ncbi:MAG: hypothetical protein L6Q66_07445 [Bacteroidia bacterium]|nr:hypothetical protein [Bacteroidia bacterium]
MSIKKKVQKIFEKLRRSNYGPKVICIGFNKAGTTSCGKAFELLGYRNLSFDPFIWRELYKKGKLKELMNIASKYDSFDDLPWLKEDMIPLLDKTFPGSKFVYLERDEESWKKSIYHWYFKEKGTYPQNMDELLEEYRSHKKFVADYFKERGNDLLTINVSSSHALKDLADFLGKKAPHPYMPHENRT